MKVPTKLLHIVENYTLPQALSFSVYNTHISKKEVTADINKKGFSSVKSFLHLTKIVASLH